MATIILYFLLFFASLYPLSFAAEKFPQAATAGWIVFVLLLTYALFLRFFRQTQPKSAMRKGERVTVFPLLGCTTPMPVAYHIFQNFLTIFSHSATPGYARGAWFATLYAGKKEIFARTLLTHRIRYEDIRTVRVIRKTARCDIRLTDGSLYVFSFYRRPMRNAFVQLLRGQQIQVSETDGMM